MKIVRFGGVSTDPCDEDFQSIREDDFAGFKAGVDIVEAERGGP